MKIEEYLAKLYADPVSVEVGSKKYTVYYFTNSLEHWDLMDIYKDSLLKMLFKEAAEIIEKEDECICLTSRYKIIRDYKKHIMRENG